MHRPRWAAAIVVWTLVAAARFQAVAQGPPTLIEVAPGAVAPGQTTELVLTGTRLTGPLRLWTSFPARIEWVASDAQAAPIPPGTSASGKNVSGKDAPPMQVRCRVTVPAGVAGGIGGLAVATQQGISDVYYVMVDDLPSVAEAAENHDPPRAQPLTLPTAVDGRSEGTLSDYFQFDARQGERIACEVVASRLGWDYDALLRICGPDGAECLLLDDDPSTGADPRGVFTAPQDGTYRIELRDHRYKAGGHYRLRLAHVPFLACAQPLVVQSGVATRLTAIDIAGQRLGPWEWLVATSHSTLPMVVTAVGLPSAPGGGSVLIGATQMPVWYEAPADAAHPSSLPELPLGGLPTVICGALEKPGEVDSYRFTARKGVGVQFRVISRSLGSPAVLTLQVTDVHHKKLAENPPTDSDEPVWTFTPTEDGVCELKVSDLIGRGGPDFAYALVVRSGPSFALQLKNDKNSRGQYAVPAGGVLALDVQCQRQGEEGPIDLAIDAPRPGWQLVNGRLPPKANEVRVYLVAPQDFAPGETVPVRIIGRPSSGEWGTVPMTTQALLRAIRPACPYPPAWHDGLLLVSGIQGGSPWFRVEPAAGSVFFPRQIGTARWELKIHRLSEDFREGNLTIVPVGLPLGMSMEAKRREAGSPEVWDLTFKGPTSFAEGSSFVRFFLVGEAKGAMRGVWTGDVELQIASPLRISAQWPAAWQPGQVHAVQVTVARLGNDPQPVELRLKGLPPGFRGPEPVILAADASQATLNVMVAEDATMGAEAKLAVVATTRYGETKIEIESAPHALQIKAP